MHLFSQQEGYGVETYQQDLTADQDNYELPEESAKIKRVFVKDSTSSNKRVIQQDRQYLGEYVTTSSGESTSFTYRLKDNHLFLYPPPSETVTNGLIIEFEVATARIANDSDKLPDSWPPFSETLLILDTAIALLESDATAEGDLGASQITWLERRRLKYEAQWDEYTATRTTSIICSPGNDWGA